MADECTAVVRALFDAFNDGDLARAVADVSEDFELVDVAAGQTFHGPDGCRQWLEMFRIALPDVRTEIINIFADGPWVGTEHIGRGTHDGPFVTSAGTIPPTGRKVEMRVGELYEVREGKIVRLHAYSDSATLMRQLGLLPPSGSAMERALTALMGAAIRTRRAVKRG